jgi:hypothetical protein
MKAATSSSAPPFAKELADVVRAGAPVQNLMVFAGPRAWEHARARVSGPKLVLPPDRWPDEFTWRAVNGLEVVVHGVDEPDYQRLGRLAHLLLLAGSPLVVVIYKDGPLVRIAAYRPDCEPYTHGR